MKFSSGLKSIDFSESISGNNFVRICAWNEHQMSFTALDFNEAELGELIKWLTIQAEKMKDNKPALPNKKK